VYVVTIATRNAVIGKEWFKWEREPDNKSDKYTGAMKDEIIIGPLLQKIFRAKFSLLD